MMGLIYLSLPEIQTCDEAVAQDPIVLCHAITGAIHAWIFSPLPFSMAMQRDGLYHLPLSAINSPLYSS
jgi:hypothetical protein